MKRLCLLVVLILVLIACNKRNENDYDKSYIPYGIKAFDVWVYNEDTDKDHYAGSVATDYANAHDRLNDAQLLAHYFAEKHRLENWNYICCTVTSSSNCVTKVR